MNYRTLNFIISHAYFIKNKALIPIAKHLKKNHNIDFMVDSGAVTLKFAKNKPHKELNMLDYWKAVKKDYYTFSNKLIAFDTIGDAEKSHNDWRLTLAQGINVIPVITNRNSLHYIEEYVQSFNWLAVTLQAGDNKLIELTYNEARKYIDNPKIHILGYSMMSNKHNPKYFSTLDASTWTNGHRFGDFYLFTSDLNVKVVGRLKEILLSKDKLMRIAPYMDRYGITFDDLMSQKGLKSYEHVVSYWNARTFLDVSERAYNLGLQYFFGSTSFNDVSALLATVCSSSYQEFKAYRSEFISELPNGSFSNLDKKLSKFNFTLVNP